VSAAIPDDVQPGGPPDRQRDDQREPRSRYDDMAGGYARFWAPVLREAAERVLDHLAPHLDGRRGAELLDVGTGTGTLAVAALERWPAIRVTGIDPSGGMLEVAGVTATERLPGATQRRFRRRVAAADRMPFRDGAFDAAMSSFVLQLVPSRAAALREIRRVLRPGGVVAWVSWQRTNRAFEPDRLANEVLDDFGFDPPGPEARSGDIASTASAAASMRRAGFREVRAWLGECTYAWDAQGYLAFLTEFDEESLFDDLEPKERAEIEGEILQRLEGLAADQLTLRLPIVYVMGRAPD
jgi:ubiquinone/menaquinone biosynthesis C-methylase UbiE